jgi:prepilin-type N-terminal cleavage/methylation domain-containing protein
MQLKKAFTIIELLIVIAIIAIISSSAFASYNTLTKQQKLTNSIKLIRDILETARRRAVSGDGNDICSALTPPMNTVDGFEISIPNSGLLPSQASLNVLCSESGASQTVPIATYPIDSVVKVNGTPITVDFQTLTGQESGSTKVVVQTNADNVKCVTISTLGVMEEMQGSACTSLPQ